MTAVIWKVTIINAKCNLQINYIRLRSHFIDPEGKIHNLPRLYPDMKVVNT